MSARLVRFFCAALCLVSGVAFAQQKAPTPAEATFYDAARGRTPIIETTDPPRLTNWVNNDERRPRNYDLQPPTIPHRIDGYQVDRNFNKCLDCHARERTGFTQAVPVSPTHYIDRAGKTLPTISTRRYFCLQCHVAQEPVRALVGNGFENVHTLMGKSPAAAPAAAPAPTKAPAKK